MMIERSKDESEKIGKYQSMLMSGVIAAVIVFLAPTLIVVILGMDNPNNLSAEDLLFAPPGNITTCSVVDSNSGAAITTESACTTAGGKWTSSGIPQQFSQRITGLFGLLMWIVRIVIVMMIIVSVIMLTVRPMESNRYYGNTRMQKI